MDYLTYEDLNDKIVTDMEMFILMGKLPDNMDEKLAIDEIIGHYAAISIILGGRWSKIQIPTPEQIEDIRKMEESI